MASEFDRPRRRGRARPGRRGCGSAIRIGLVCALLPLAGFVANPSARAGAQIGTVASVAEVAPADAVAFLQVPLDESSEQWVLAEDLLDRAGLGPALDQARREGLTDASGNPLPLDAFLGGEAGIVVMAAALEQAVAASGLPGGGDDAEASPAAGVPAAAAAGVPAAAPAGWAVILDARAPDTAFAGLRDAIAEQAEETGNPVTETDYAGVPITATAGDPASAGNETGLAAARVDEHVLIASVPADLEPVIDAAQGTTDSIADLAVFDRVRGALPDEALLIGFVNGLATREAQAALGGIGAATGVAVGTGRVGGFAIMADQPGFRMETVAASADGSPLPAGAANFEPGLLARTPDDALFFLSGSDLGRTGILQGLGAIALGGLTAGFGAAPTPDAGQTAEEFVDARYEAAAAFLGINLKADLLDRLVGEYGVWIRSEADPASLTALFASGVDDAGAVVNALSRLTLLIQGGAEGESAAATRTVDGASVTTISLGPGAPALEYGVVDDRLLVGIGDAIDRDASGDAGLDENAQYQAAMDLLPAEGSGRLYVDLGRVIPLLQGLGESGVGMAAPTIPDASEGCANYASQAAAQAAYDNFEEGTFDLDQDFDGQVCEDYFPPAAEDGGAGADALAAAEALDLSGIRAFALVAYDADGLRRSSSILVIADGGS